MQYALLGCLAALTMCLAAQAAGPRWVAGGTWYADSQAMRWYRPDVQYFVDAGALSPQVDHATATALVDAAAAVWTAEGVPFSLSNGGALDEDVSSENVYPGADGPVWPTDVQKSNYMAKQIAVLFDTDGSLTDMLLGSGASAPGNCRTNAVTESVDLFIQPGRIAHALVILNGRCTGPAPEQQLQLRYQLMRVFGRVIGLGWSQLNDNVFTGTPTPQYSEQMHWPIMHPIDVICGPYTYQCLPQPFTLRDDDIASLAMVYAGQLNQNNPNKVTTSGWLCFPNGQGMNGVNLVARRNYPNDGYGTEPYGIVSVVSGFLAPGDKGNPVTGLSADADDKQGGTGGFAPGYFVFYGVPSLRQFAYTSLEISTEPVNPLYTGAYAVGPYRLGGVAPAGDALQFTSFGNAPGGTSGVGTFVPANAAFQCQPNGDGTENAPAPLVREGVWSGRLCGVGHTAWTGFAVRRGRTATIEVTAVDETGAATTTKSMPVAGLWHGSDAPGTAPTIRRAVAFNSVRVGTTQLRASFTADEPVRLAITDQRGEGRPDFLYRARVLYADTVSPSRLGPGGGAIRITGTGFQLGSVVTVGGVVASVTGVSTTEISAVAPASAALGNATVNDVTVTDPRTGGSTTIAGGLTYGGAADDVLTLVTAPAATVSVGSSNALVVRVTDSAGVPAARATVAVSATGSQTVFSTCGLAGCTLVTDESGLAATSVLSQAAGSVTLRAVAKSGSAVQSTYVAVAAARSITLRRPLQYVAAGAGAVFHPAAMLTGSDAEAAARSVAWSAGSARIALGSVAASGSVSQVEATGSLRDGENTTVQACAWTAVCAVESVVGVSAADLRVVPVEGDAQSIAASGTLRTVTVRVVDTAGHPVAGAAVAVYQEATGWQPPCGAPGRCPVPPVYGTARSAGSSDDDGLLQVQPLQYTGTAATTRIAVTAGSAGVLTTVLQKTP